MDRKDFLKRLDCVFQRPIREGYDAVPVGNGDLAAVLWQPEHLTLMLNKCDISMEASQAARLVFETSVPLAERGGDIETRLSLASATATVRHRSSWAKLSVSAYVPENRNVLLLDYEENASRPNPLRIRLERWIQDGWGEDVEASVKSGIPVISYALKSGVRYAVAMAFSGFAGVSLKKTGAVQLTVAVPGAKSVKGRLAVAVVTGREAEDVVAGAMRLVKRTLAEDPVQLKKNNDAFWAGFWDRSFVDSGHPYANMLYHMALYEMGITSRGARPVKFNGALNLWNENARTWGGAYWCHNQHSPYLPVYAANHAELADNFLAWIIKVRPEAVKAAGKYHRASGAYYPEVMDHGFKVDSPEVHVPERKSGNLPFHWELKYILSSGTRYALLLWGRYQHTLDEEFLREAYPVIRDVAEFYVSYGRLGKDGKYHLSPSISWETRPLGRDSHSDCAAWRAIFPIAIRAARILGNDSDKIKVWRDRLRKAPPYPVNGDGVFSVVMKNDGKPEPSNHFIWQVSNLTSLFPYGSIGMGSTSRLRRTAKATFNRYRYNADAGHEYIPLYAARLGLAEEWRCALFQFMQFFQCYDQGLFNYYSIVGNKTEESEEGRRGLHPYLESSGIFAASVSEMLMQGHDGTIRICPSIPGHWHSRFILRAAGSFMVASEHRGKEGVPYILVQPLGGEERECSVELPWKDGVSLAAGGKDVQFRLRGRRLSFMAKPGAVYALTPKGRRLDEIPVVKVAADFSGSPARIGMTWYGQRKGANNHTGDFPLW